MTVQFFDGCVIMGQGKAGSALAQSLTDANVSISALISKSQAQKAPHDKSIFASLAQWQKNHDGAPPVFFVAWPDGAVSDAVSQFVDLNIQPKALIHLSGVCPPEVWLPLNNQYPTGTFHPNEVLRHHHGFGEHIGVGIEASTPVLYQALKALAEKLKLSVVSLEGVNRSAYHLAAVSVANLSLVLVKHAIQLWTEQGFSQNEAQSAMGNLLRSCALRVTTAPPEEILTGPVARADLDTVKEHLNFLQQHPQHDALLKTYRLLSEQLLVLASHEPKTHQELAMLLQGESDQSK